MAVIGKYNKLAVVREAPPGLYLNGGESGEILLPRRYIPRAAQPGTLLDVFVYLDSEDRLVATMETPRACAGDFACLQVVSVNSNVGAFLDWGLAKDLLLPFREQEQPVRPRQWVVVFIYLDEPSGRIVATTRLNRHLSREMPPYHKGQSVTLLAVRKTPFGHNVIVENTYRGLLFHDHIAAPLETGQKLKGFVRAVRADGKIDLSLDAVGYQRVTSLKDRIIEALEKSGGRLPFDDDTPPETIREKFGSSKKAFKQALGALYKDRRIRFSNPGIELISMNKATRK